VLLRIQHRSLPAYECGGSIYPETEVKAGHPCCYHLQSRLLYQRVEEYAMSVMNFVKGLTSYLNFTASGTENSCLMLHMTRKSNWLNVFVTCLFMLVKA
jgi:hypothetical protein